MSVEEIMTAPESRPSSFRLDDKTLLLIARRISASPRLRIRAHAEAFISTVPASVVRCTISSSSPPTWKSWPLSGGRSDAERESGGWWSWALDEEIVITVTSAVGWASMMSLMKELRSMGLSLWVMADLVVVTTTGWRTFGADNQ